VRRSEVPASPDDDLRKAGAADLKFVNCKRLKMGHELRKPDAIMLDIAMIPAITTPRLK